MQTHDDYLRYGPRKEPPGLVFRPSGIEWRDRLLRTLFDNGVSQPIRDANAGHALVRLGWVATIGAALLMLTLAFWNAASGDIDMSDYDEIMRLPGTSGQEIAWLAAEKERVRLQREMDHDRHVAIFAAVAGILYPAGITLAVRLFPKGRRTLAPDAFAEFDRLPDRRPVLFLRPFERDPSDKATLIKGLAPGDPFELAAVKELRRLGPVIAVGKPGEKLPPLGAGRLYVPEDRWQTVILELLAASQYVFFVFGSTAGLFWELQTIVERVHPAKVIVCIPPDRRGENRREAWLRFRDRTRDVFPKPLPENPGPAFLMHFDESWRPILVAPPSGPSILRTMNIRKAIRALVAENTRAKAANL